MATITPTGIQGTGSIVPTEQNQAVTAPKPPIPSQTTTPAPSVPAAVPQSIIDNAKANPSVTSPTGKDVFGNPVTLPSSSNTNADTTSTGTATDPNQQALSDAQAARAQADADYQAQAQTVHDTITNIENGTTPLTPGEQAQVDGLRAQFQTLIDAQNLTNKGASGTANIRGYQTGAAEYDPTFQVKTIGAVITAGQQKIADLNTKLASAVASLTDSFHSNDIKAVTDAWNIYSDAAKEHAAQLQQTVSDAQAAIKSAQDASQNAQAEADKQAQYQLDVQKFQQTGDQNSFDNALKTEQEKYQEQKDAAAASETARHDKATEAIDAFKAGMGAGGGSNIPNVPAATITADGNPDPASQKAVLDGITQQYGPATALAIKSLSDYSMNPADWSVRSGKGMTREEAVTLAKMYDPTYNDANYAIRAAYMKNLASSQTGTIGSAVNAANKSINHLTAYVNTMAQLNTGPGTLPGGAGQTKIGNTVGNFIGSLTNSSTRQNIAAANTEGLGVAEELAKFFKGSGTVDVASIDAWKSQLSTNATPADVKGTTQGAITLLAGQLETLTEQYSSTMGKAPTTDFLGPSARASLSNLKNQGYDVPISGINYTDKNAYLANGGSTDDLNKAYQTLVSANDPNNPPTPDNVLELAQIQ